MKKYIFAGIMVLVITAAIIYVVPWGNYESQLDKSELTENSEEKDSSGQTIPSLDQIEGHFTLDTAHKNKAEILFEIDGLKDTKGAYEKFDIQFDIAEDYTNSKLNVVIDAGSVNTNNSMRDESLVSDEFFDVQQYPTIEYHANEIAVTDTGYVAKGNLTLMATTKELEFPFKHLGNGTYDNEIPFEAFEGTFVFDRTEYGMPEEGGVGNLVTIHFYCELVGEN